MSDREVGRIAQATDSQTGNHAINGMWAKGGDAQSFHLQAQVAKYDNSVSLPKLELTGSLADNNVKNTGYNDGTRQLHEGHATTTVNDGAARPSHYASDYDNVPTDQGRRQTHQANAAAEGHGYHGWVSFPPKKDANNRWHQPGLLEVDMKPGDYREGARMGDLPIPAKNGRDNYYNALLDAHYEHGKLVGTPARVVNNQVTDQYPGTVGVKCK